MASAPPPADASSSSPPIAPPVVVDSAAAAAAQAGWGGLAGLQGVLQPYHSFGVQERSPVAWNSRGDHIAFVSADGSVLVASVDAPQPAGSLLQGHKEESGKTALAPAPRPPSWDTETVAVLSGQTGRVLDLLWSPLDASILFSAGTDGIWAWNVDAGYCVAFLPVTDSTQQRQEQAAGRGVTMHSHDVECLAWVIPGVVLASGSKDTDVKLWDVRQLQPGRQAKGLIQDPTKPGPPRTMFLNGMQLLETIDAHKDAVLSIASHPTAARLATTGRDGAIKVWDTTHISARFEQAAVAEGRQGGAAGASSARCEVLGSMEGHRGDVTTVVWSPDGSRLLTGGRDNEILAWDAETFKDLGEVRDSSAGLDGAHRGDVRMLLPCTHRYLSNVQEVSQGEGVEPAYGEDHFVVSCSMDGSVILWSVPASTLSRPHESGISTRSAEDEAALDAILADILAGTALDPNAGGARAAEAEDAHPGTHKALPDVTISQRMLLPRTRSPSELVTSGVLGGDATRGLSGDMPGRLADGATLAANAVGVCSMAASPSGHAFALTTTDGALMLFSLLPPAPAVLPALDVVPASQRWAYALARRCPSAVMQGGSSTITGAAAIDGGDSAPSLLISSSADGEVCVLDMSTGVRLFAAGIGTAATALTLGGAHVPGMTEAFADVTGAGAPEPLSVRLLFVAAADYSVRVFALATAGAAARAVEIGALLGHEGRVLDVALHPNQHVVATAAADFTVRLWNVAGMVGSSNPQKGADAAVLPGSKGSMALTLISPSLTLRPHTSRTTHIAFRGGAAEDASAALITTGDDHTVKMFTVKCSSGGTPRATKVWTSALAEGSASPPEGVAVGPCAGHTGVVSCAVWAPPGGPSEGLVFTGGWDGTVCVWLGEGGAPGVRSMAQGDRASAASHLRQRSPLCGLHGHSGHIADLACTPSGRQLLTADSSGLVLQWHTVPGGEGEPFRALRRFHATLRPSSASVFAPSTLLAPSDDFLLSGSRGGHMCVWALRQPKEDDDAPSPLRPDTVVGGDTTEALVDMARRGSVSPPGARRQLRGKKQRMSQSGLGMFGTLRQGSLRNLDLVGDAESAAPPSVSQGRASTRSATVLGQAGRSGSKFHLELKGDAQSVLAAHSATGRRQVGSHSPTRRSPARASFSPGTTVNNPLAVAKARGQERRYERATGSTSASRARNPLHSPQSGQAPVQHEWEGDVEVPAMPEQSSLPGGAQVTASPLHGGTLPHQRTTGGRLADLPSQAPGHGPEGGDEDAESTGSGEAAGATLAFSPTSTRREGASGDMATSDAMTADDVAATTGGL